MKSSLILNRARASQAALLIATGLLLRTGSPDAFAAANDTWTGGGASDNWSDANNWGGTPIAPTDFLFFDGSTRLTPNNDSAAGTIYGNITFNPGADLFTLGGNALTLTNGLDAGSGQVTGGNITNSSFNPETISLPITFLPGRHIITVDPGAGQLNLGGAITRNSGACFTFIQNGGIINVSGSGLANINGILGGGAHINTGGVFTDWAALDGGNNVVAYSGYTDVSSGAIANNAASNVRLTADTAAFTAANGTTVNSILSQITGAGRNLTVTGVLRLGARGGIFASGSASQTLTVTGGSLTTAGSGGEINLLSVPGSTTARLTVTSTITNDTGNAPVTVTVQGYMTLNGANTYSGGTYIFNNGRVTTGNGLNFGTGPVFIYPNGQIFFNNNATFTNSFDITGSGTTEANSGITGPGAYRVSSTAVISGKTTFHGKTRISTSATPGGAITGQIVGDNQLEIITFATANSQLMLSNSNNPANSWPGGTLINCLGTSRAVTVRLGANEQIPDGAGAGDVILNCTNAADFAKFDLNGRNETINGLIATNATPAAGQITNSGTGPSTLTLGNNNASASYNGSIKDSGFPSNALSVVKIGTGTQTLGGANAWGGNITVNAGKLAFGDSSTFPANSKLTVNSNATIDVQNVPPINFGTNAVTSSNGTFVVTLVSGANAITTPTLNALGATNFITVASIPAISTYPAQFVVIKATNNVVGSLNFGLGGALPISPSTPFAGYVSNNVANNSVDVVITAGPLSIKWAGYDGTGLNSSWDTSTTDWKTFANVLTTYADGDFVNFDDSASNATVSANVNVSPAGITIANNALPYTLTGSGKITGGGGILKQGSQSFTVDNTGPNDFAGDINISAGTLRFGNLDSGGTIPTTASIIDNGTIIFGRGDSITVPNLISGTGAVVENGNASAVVTLSAANTFSGPVTISAGTLQLGSSSALGTTNAGTTVQSGGTLDIGANAINIGQEQVSIIGSGAGGIGALVNNSGSPTFAGANLSRLVLIGDAAVGGTGRLDLRSSNTGDPSLTSLSTTNANRKLTKVGPAQFSLVGANVDPALGDIEVQQGWLSVETVTTGLGNPANKLSIFSGAVLQMFAPTNQLNKNFVLYDTATVSNSSGNNTIIGPMNITNYNTVSASSNPGALISFKVGGTAPASLTLSNVITGNGIIYKEANTNTLTLAGNSPNFAGGITINVIGNVTLASSGTLSNALGITVNIGNFNMNGTLLGAGVTNQFGANFTGSGSSAGIADVSGNLFPGASNSVGTITLGGLILEGSGNLGFDLGYATNIGGTANDLIVVNGNLVLNGGSITINPLSLLRKAPAYRYRLINYTGTLVNNGAPSVNIPQNYTGTLDLSTPGQVNLQVTGGPAVWNGGSATTSNWSDSANWSNIPLSAGASAYFDGNVRVSNNNDTAPGTIYQDLSFAPEAAAFTLNGNDIGLNGNLINTSTNPQTVLIPISSSANNTLNGGTNGPNSKLIIGGGWTNTSGSGSTMTLVGNGTLTNLLFTANTGITNTILLTDTNANWFVTDNAASAGMTNPVIIDDQAGTFSFGQGSSAPTLSTTSSGVSRVGVISGQPATFNMNNGTLTFVGRFNTGTGLGSVATINQSGGTLDAQALLQLSDGASNAFTTVNLSGGTLNVGTPTAQSLFLCSRGTGIFNVTISGVVRCATFDVSRNIGPTYGKVNIDGGRMEVNRFGTATSASTGVAGAVAILNFNGGLVLARQNNATFIQGATTCPITCMVRSGGAKIDSTNFNITVLEPLQHDTNAAAPATDGGLLKLGSGILTLTAGNSYTGPTTISNGTLAVNGSISTNTCTVATNGVLAGTGTINGAVTVQQGGAVAPAGNGVTGTLIVSNNVTFQPGSTAIMEVNKSPTANDLLIARNTNATTITFNGTLIVTNLAGNYANGDSFKLFSATNYSGAFTSIQPAQPAIGFKWDTSQLNTAGILTVVGLPHPGITNVVASGGNITIGGTNGTPGFSYRVLGSSDILLPRSSWTILGTNTFGAGGTFLFSVGTTNQVQFFIVQAL